MNDLESNDLDAILLQLEKNYTRSINQHFLVIGPRGSGKTTLVLRTAAEISRTAEAISAVELLSPRNKDRPAARQAFAVKCVGYLQQGSNVVVVDTA